ncbi:usherin-like [Clytia hemisphaerica]|uniref:Usherin n=1 Tax=Clytia hemisphaerica TaxID=252671 RepID=A0A7M5USH2_9CNID
MIRMDEFRGSSKFDIVPWKFRRKNLSKTNKKTFHHIVCFCFGFPQAFDMKFCMVFVFFIQFFGVTNGQQLKGLFPAIKDLSSFTDIKTSSTCGLNNNQMTYCISTVEDSSTSSCTQRTCLLNCCLTCGTSLPTYIDLDKAQRSNGVFISSSRQPYDKDIRSTSWSFTDNGFISYSSVSDTSNFTFTTWFKQQKSNNGVLLFKPSVFTIYIQEYKIIFEYYTKGSPTIINKLEFVNVNFEQDKWHHVALVFTVYDISLFIDGTPVRTSILSGIVLNKAGSIRVGQNLQGDQYKGLMQDIRFFSKGLTNREIVECQKGVIPDVPYSQCRCPESHPRISPSNVFHCMKNGAQSSQRIERLSKESHVPEYLVDGEAITYWISEQTNEVTIDIDLKYSKLQVFLVSILFYSPPAKGMKIERSLDFGKTYQAWQYFSDDCQQSFGIPDDGVLPEPDSVNCIKIPNPRPSWESIAFQPAEAGPDNRPQRPFGVNGCNDFYCSPKLLRFVEATNVKITLKGHTLVSHSDHQYFGVRRIVVGGSCDCYGHATQCEYNQTTIPNPSYTCQCDSRTFTHGQQCEKCLPLYNDKKFARGTVLNANKCKRCQCNNQADECYYNPSLDTAPDDRNAPGGGVCIGCKHNTIGRYCDQCKAWYYRPSDKALSDPDVCQPCNCIGPGISNVQLECEKDDTNGKVAGQCHCKKYAAGRQCTECKSGYYLLSPTNPDGCSNCQCNTPGTVNNDPGCHISSGQCTCKRNVIGVKCTNCKPGFYGLDGVNPDGCSRCDCSSLGSDLSTTCDPQTGQCKCKAKYQGRQCNQCVDGFFGPTCQPCVCNSIGTVAGSTSCNQDTGQCVCKRNVEGISCNQCKVGYYGLSASNPNGCMVCSCDSKGTVGNTGQCDQQSGLCTCKKLVTGRSCNLCQVGTYGLSAVKVDGCTRCDCDPKGTVSGDKTPKDQLVCTSTGQCSCLSNVDGQKCDRCITGYYWNPNGLGCLACACDPQGSLSSLCSSTGQCQCRTSDGLTGLRCNECQSGYYGYSNGRCLSCGCLAAGRTGTNCNSVGICTECKRNVAGSKCNVCKQGTTNLEAANPYGCSGVPNQQGPPRVTSKTSTSISLAWSQPDDPNGIILRYQLQRNGSSVYTGTQLTYTDTSLSPFTTYLYDVYAFTSAGSAKSVDSLLTRTYGDVPKGVSAPTISQIKDRSVIATWNPPSRPNGIIKRYTLVSKQKNNVETSHYSGLITTVQVTALSPFTVYNFSVIACTEDGCTRSSGVIISTKSAAPDSQPAPYVRLLTGGTSLVVTWDAPSRPNGEIQFYDLMQRNAPFQGEGNTLGVRLTPDNRTFDVTGLLPYTEYELRIVAYTTQVKGSTTSNWTRIRTLEGVPSGQPKPFTTSYSSSTMNLTWSSPTSPAGIITRYEVYHYNKETNYLRPILSTSTTGLVKESMITKLSPYTLYQFSIKACNNYACTSHSSKTSAQSLAATPGGQSPPVASIHNSTAVNLVWIDPARPNGPTPVSFKVSMTKPLYNTPPTDVIRGVQFNGFGYYRFSGSHIPDSATTLMTLRFKTKFPDGLLLFASSTGQEDLIVIELRNGKPWFIFDTESGPAAFTVQSQATFNDNQWHEVEVSRDMRNGEIIVDKVHKGSGSSSGDKNVIGQISAIFVGGLPKDYVIKRKDSGEASINRFSFIGCVLDITFKNIPLDFKSFQSKANVPPLSDHCALYPHHGVYFKGFGYLVLNRGVFNGGPNFHISFKLRTSYTDGLVLYAEGMNTYFIIYIENKNLFLRYKQPARADIRYTLASNDFCDNKLHEITIENKAGQLTANIDGDAKNIAILTSDMTVSSETYIGGVPATVNSVILREYRIETHLGGCLQDLKIGSSILNYQYVIKEHYNVDFNGCPGLSTNTGNKPECSNPNITTVYDGQQKKTVSGGLISFTEYLYQVSSYHANVAGKADSPWIVIRTGEGVPSGLSKPVFKAKGAEHINVTWSATTNENGLISRYTIRVYQVINGNPVRVQTKDVTTDNFETKIDQLLPATTYHVTIDAMTSAGGVESLPLIVKTFAAAPEEFDQPTYTRFPRALNITWRPLRKPNGLILFYQLEVNGTPRYNGKGLNVYVDKLNVYTLYELKLMVCGEIACSSTKTMAYTGELAPDSVIAPQVTVLDGNRVLVTWSKPNQSNGKITKYEVYQSLDTSTNNLKLVFNATAVTNQATINKLIPGTTYYFRIRAYTEAGGTLGDAAQVKTAESAPSGVPSPMVTPFNDTTILVKIYPPALPNGVITKYRIIQDGVPVYETSTLPTKDYVAGGLMPFTKHAFHVEVCTAKGCALSDTVTSFTRHGVPEGSIILTINNIKSRSFNASWTSIAKPNGPINYTVYTHGEFYSQPGVNFITVNKTETCYSGEDSNVVYACAGLLPRALYEVHVNGSNDAGFILSNQVKVLTQSDVPDGVAAPIVQSLNSTTIQLSWQPPGRSNGRIQNYSLHAYYPLDDYGSFGQVVLKTGMFNAYTVTRLKAFTQYAFRVEARNEIGSSMGPWTNVTTREAVPESVDAAKLSFTGARRIVLELSPPAKPNGVIVHYRIYLNNTLINTTLERVITVHNLKPYSNYNIYFSACTSVGCADSPRVNFRTLQDVPEGVSAPILTSNGSRSVVIRWFQPNSNNGLIVCYIIQRLQGSSTTPTNVAKLNASFWNTYVDTTVVPYTLYQYRIVAYTSVGGTPSPYNSITTPQSAPEGINPPTISNISQTSFTVSWNTPSTPNGIILYYLVSVSSDSTRKESRVLNTVYQYFINDLASYVEYTIIIKACNSGGCGSSAASKVRTLAAPPKLQAPPSAIALSNSSLRVRWDEPRAPNGPIQRYVLEHRTIESLLTEQITQPTTWRRIYEGTATVFDHSQLGIFSQQQYMVTCFTDEGNATSEKSLYYRTGPGYPTSGPTVAVQVVDHVSVRTSWTDPPFQQIKGIVKSYTVSYEIVGRSGFYTFATLPGNQSSTIVNNLRPSTEYDFRVSLFNGAGHQTSSAVRAKTLAGIPEGFDKPIIYDITSRSIRVSWQPPRTPNGDVQNYTIIANDQRMDTVSSTTTFHHQQNLKPFTAYVIKIQVCTDFMCILSPSENTKTYADAPENIAAPTLKSLNGNSIEVNWKKPNEENGLMIGYNLFRRSTIQCPQKEKPVQKCTFITCKINEQLCGTKCYDPKVQVCCNGTLYQSDPQKTCCNQNYIKKNSPTDVCCGGQFHPNQNTYQCCFGHYRQILSGQVCCHGNNGVVVGNGNQCCGDIPYDGNGDKLCLCGALYNKANNVRQCCGNKIVSIAETCCGSGDQANAHAYDANKVCCGTSYVNQGTSLCCQNTVNQFKVYTYSSSSEKLKHKCCGTNRISTASTCCNENPYASSTHVCADRSSDGATTDCGKGSTCPLAQSLSAYCDQCDFDTSKQICGHVSGYFNKSAEGVTPGMCKTSYAQILININNPNIFRFVDNGLLPHTEYEYYVVGRNLVGNTTSPVSSIMTSMSTPESLQPPVPTVISFARIAITWSEPLKPNGIITKYTLYRTKWSTKQEHMVYTGLALTHTDNQQLEPFTGYMYTLEVCTNLCANISAGSLVYTEESTPENVLPPTLTTLSSTSIEVNWTSPAKPNGVITRYNVTMVRDGAHVSILPANNLGEAKSQIVNNLQAYTEYTFRIEACTKIGCALGPEASQKTLQAVPTGLKAPRVIVMSARQIHVEWNKPTDANGVLKYYVILRNGSVVFNTTTRVFIDDKVRPASTYNYVIRAHNEAGGSISPSTIISTPESSPEGIPAPTLIPLTSVSINVTWSPPTVPNGVVTAYYISHQEIDGPITKELNTGPQWHVIKGLKPYTFYNIRIEACTNAGCGTGPRMMSRTKESTPFGQQPPALTAKSSTMVEIKWLPPLTPNGDVTEYLIERRQGDSGMPFKIYIGSRVEYIDTQLKPYTSYQYRVRSKNSVGDAVSSWASVRTHQGVPQAIQPPRVNVLNGTSVEVEWSTPGVSNGIINSYIIRYRLFSLTGSNYEEVCCIKANEFKTKVHDLKPATSYEFQIGAATSAGEGFSSWALVKTKEAPPSSVPTLMANTNPLGTDDGTVMEIYWDEPEGSNGVITKYVLHDQFSVVYEGLERKALIRKLQPFTNYTFRLVVFNSAGHLSGPIQTLRSGEVTPRGQLPPTVPFVNSSRVHLEWKVPLFPHGDIIRYEIIREEVQARRRKRAETLVTTLPGSASDLAFIDENVKPFTTYRYKVRTVNSQGSVDSEWVTVTTPEAAPLGVSRVHLSVLTDTQIRLDWKEPTTPNGIVRYYNIYRNGTRIDSTSSLQYTDISGLQPSTYYSYQIEACTAGGCTKGPLNTTRTLETAPSEISPPTYTDIKPTSVFVKWKAPTTPNGVINKYQLFIGDQRVPLFEGVGLEYTVVGLEIFTRYSFRVSACTSRGCTASTSSFVTTAEDIPEGLNLPDLYVLGPTAIDVRWTEPQKPNGIIRYYLVKRTLQNFVNVVYNGTDLKFTDRTVSPGTSYGYAIEAYNTAGHITSQIAYSDQTGASAPEDVKAPVLEALTSTNILAKWDVPGKTNGAIVAYYLLYDKQIINVGTVRVYTVSNLSPYTQYELRVKACTSLRETDCATSPASSIRTKEAAPEQQNSPSFEAKHIKGESVQASWVEPRVPNGKIIKYVLYRRSDDQNTTKVYEGPNLSFTDDKSIKPNTRYEYKVVAHNSVGSTESQWSAVTTDNSVPSNIPNLAIDVSSVSSTEITVRISEPKESNGGIIQYYIEVASDQGADGRNITISPTTSSYTITNLNPQTTYHFRLYACNKIGCGASGVTTHATKQANPTGMGRPRISDVTTTLFNVSWAPPTEPNGRIERYELRVEYKCPQPSIPVGCREWTRDPKPPGLGTSFVVDDLDPYRKYHVSVIAFNQVGSVRSETISQTTLSDKPKAVAPPKVSISEATPTTVIVDWSESFQLNGPVVEYAMYQNDIKTLTAKAGDLNWNGPDRAVGTYRYKVTLTTLVGNTEEQVTTEEAVITVIGNSGTPSTSAQTAETPWYRTVWFLALCALAGLLIIFLIIVCCCRGYGRNRTVYVRQRDPLPRKAKFGARSTTDNYLNNNGQFSDFPPNLKLSTTNINEDDTIYQDGVVFAPKDSSRYTSTRELLDNGSSQHDLNMDKFTAAEDDDDEDGDFIWDQTNDDSRDLDSGLYDDDGVSPNYTEPEIETTQDGFVSMQQERIMFPDTHL